MSGREFEEVILLPAKGWRARVEDSATGAAFLCSLRADVGIGAGGAVAQPQLEFDMRVLDSIYEDGAKLCRIDMASVAPLRAKYPGVRVVPVSYCTTALKARPAVRDRAATGSASSNKTIFRVVSAVDGSPLPRATVTAFTDFDNGIGDERTTNRAGEVHLSLGRPRSVERVYVEPRANYWSRLVMEVSIRSNNVIELQPIDLAFTDCLRFFYGNAELDMGEGVKVGIVDSGIAEHPDLRIDGGVNTVTGESPHAIGDSGSGHGTHVAGIIAARGTPARGIRGLAPGVTLRSYRVFGRGKEKSTTWAIAKAIDRAVADGCDLVNVSIVGPRHSVVTNEAIEDARSRGTLVIAAAGNDGREAVSFPAAEPLAIAVTAMGRKRTFPISSAHRDEIARPFGEDSDDFVAGFTNVGQEVDIIGPGVGIISTTPHGYAAWDGTSMAAPAVTGAIARLLSKAPQILQMPKTQARAEAMSELVFRAAVRMGFGARHEGQGRIDLPL